MDCREDDDKCEDDSEGEVELVGPEIESDEDKNV